MSKKPDKEPSLRIHLNPFEQGEIVVRENNPRWNFSLFQLRKQLPFPHQPTRQAFDDLLAVQLRAITLARLFQERGSISPKMLEEMLGKQKLPPVKLRELMAFLAGIVSGVGYNSEFKLQVFGEHSMHDGEFETLHASLNGLIIMMNELGATEVKTKGPLELAAVAVKPPVDPEEQRAAKKARKKSKGKKAAPKGGKKASSKKTRRK